MAIDFNSPAAFLLLWLLLLVYALHRRRRSRREVPIPSMHLLPEATALGGPAGGTPVDLVLLFIRLALVAALITALAGPLVRGIGVERMALVVDVSASMAAPDSGDPGRSRIQVAVERANALVGRERPGKIIVVAAGPEPRIVGGWLSPAEVAGTLATLKPGDGGADLDLAATEAAALVGQGSVHVLSDGGLAPTDNRAITLFSFRPHAHVPERGTFLVTVRRTAGGEPREELFVQVEARGETVGVLRFDVDEGGEATASLEYRGPGHGPARARITGERTDSLPADDVAHAYLPPLIRPHIALVTPGNPELERALAAWPRGRVTTHPPGRHPKAELLVLDGEAAPARDRAAVLVRPPTESVSGPAVPVPAFDSPGAGIAAAASLKLRDWQRLPVAPPGARTLLTASGAADRPLLWARSAPGPARAALAFDPGRSGLEGSPLHAALWADLLSDLLLPADGGCRRVPVGHRSPEGPLTRAALYKMDSGCYVAGVPEVESLGPAGGLGEEGSKAGSASAARAGEGSRRDVADWLAGLAALLLLLEALIAARSRGTAAPRRGLQAWLLRALQLGALAGLAVGAVGLPGVGAGGREVVAVLDGSASVPAAGRQAAAARLKRWAARLPRDGRLRVLLAGGSVERVALGDLAAAASRGLPGGSDLGSALAAAGRLAGPGGAVVLLSDGRHRGGESPEVAAARLRRGDVTVHATGAWASGGDIWVSAVSVPPGTRAESNAPVTVVVRGVGIAVSATVILRLDGAEVGRAEIAVPEGGSATVTTSVLFPEAGRREVRAELVGVPEGDDPANNVGGALVSVSGRARTLVVRRGGEPGDLLGPVLASAGHTVERAPPEAMPGDASGLLAYDLVVLDDVPLKAAGPKAAEALAGYVRAGGGLLVAGGRHSFGPGGYDGSALDEVLPLRSDPRKVGGRLGAVLLLDKSGSMGGDEGGWERLLLAKATVRSLLRSFRHADDLVGILGYDTGPVVVLPMHRVGEVRPELVDTGDLHPAGGTNPVAALRLAELWLADSERYPFRHVILISDGRFPGKQAEATIAELAEGGIEISAVGVGPAADDDRLRALARIGGGGYTPVRDLRDLPAVVGRHILAAPGDPILEELLPVEVGPAVGGLMAASLGPIPPVNGLVRTALRDDAHLWLTTLSGEPLLAGTRRGAGRAVALATDARGEWTATWAGWDGFDRLLGAAVGWATRRSRGAWDATVLESPGGELVVRLDAVDGSGAPVVGLAPEAVVDAPGGKQLRIPLSADSPGGYSGAFGAEARGAYHVAAVVDGAEVARTGRLHLASQELRSRGDDSAALRRIADAGGGRLLRPTDPLPVPEGGGGPAKPARGWPLSLALALCLAYLWLEGRVYSYPI